MSQSEYEHECSRAELLGIVRPTWEEFCERQNNRKVEEESDAVVDGDNGQTEPDPALAEEVSGQGENIRRAVGGLDELNSILASTQHKINKFKTVCGSFTNLMKLKSWRSEGVGEATHEGGCSSLPATPNRRISGSAEGGDMEAEVAMQVDRLDSLIGKAERAELSMASQNKQMKSYLKK